MAKPIIWPRWSKKFTRALEMERDLSALYAPIPQAQPRMKIWRPPKGSRGTQRDFGEWARKRKGERESELACLKRFCAIYLWQNPKTGKIQKMNSATIQKSLYCKNHVEGHIETT